MSGVETLEQWRPIQGAPEYEVSDWGRLRSYRQRHGRRETPRLRKPVSNNGAMQVLIRWNGVLKSKSVHRLVLEAFRGPCPPGCEACHNDGNYQNNRVENLRWDTHASNMADKVRHQAMRKGLWHPNWKLHRRDRDLIRKLVRRGFSTGTVATLYGVCAATVRKITWETRTPRQSSAGRRHPASRGMGRRCGLNQRALAYNALATDGRATRL